MRAGAVTLADHVNADRDALFCSDFLDLATFVGLRPDFAVVPKIVYCHENQLTYPLQDESLRDYHFAFTNITTCLAADRVLFNSRYHRETFLEAIPSFLKRMPDHRPEKVVERIAARSEVLYPGVDMTAIDAARTARRPGREGPLTILWNHRWEYDKAPETFFHALFALADEDADFRVCVLGERFRDSPAIFSKAQERLRRRIVQFGFARDRREYADWLARCDVAVSTAIHEFFGVAMIEAMAAGCCPLLPDRLTYPELLPETHHATHLYANERDLLDRLRALVVDPAIARSVDLRSDMSPFEWTYAAPRFDRIFERLCE